MLPENDWKMEEILELHSEQLTNPLLFRDLCEYLVLRDRLASDLCSPSPVEKPNPLRLTRLVILLPRLGSLPRVLPYLLIKTMTMPR